jgi:hypothetical protein
MVIPMVQLVVEVDLIAANSNRQLTLADEVSAQASTNLRCRRGSDPAIISTGSRLNTAALFW